MKVRTRRPPEGEGNLSSRRGVSQYLYLLVKVRTADGIALAAGLKLHVAIPIPSGEGQNIKQSEEEPDNEFVAIPIPSGEGQNLGSELLQVKFRR